MGGMDGDGSDRPDRLFAAAREGDGDALLRLVQRHEGVLRRRIEHVLPQALRRRLSVSDVLQETRLVALERRDRFDWRSDGALRAWLLAIAENKARRAVQRHVRVGKRSLLHEVTRARRPDTGLVAGAEPTPSEAAVGNETAEIARRAMQELKPEYREVLRLCREEDLTLVQAAERLGRSHAATKKLYGRALARFSAVFHRLRGGDEG
jgi:RNA polymerase sigma-70 factor (ECF subfamily)